LELLSACSEVNSNSFSGPCETIPYGAHNSKPAGSERILDWSKLGEGLRFTGFALAILLSLSFPHRSESQQRQVVINTPSIKVEALLHVHSNNCGVMDLPNESIQIATCTQLVITNRSSSWITAWATIQYENPSAGGPLPRFTGGGMIDSLTSDFGLTSKAPGIPPHATRLSILPNCNGVVLKAVIFSDGSTLGDPDWTRAIVEHRREVYRDANDSLKELSAAKRTGVPIRDLVARFRSLARHENKEEVHPASPGTPWAIIAPPGVFGNLAFNLASTVAKPEIAQQEAIGFWQNGMRKLVRQLRASRPTIKPLTPGP
jgi:hypothetical protein